MKFLKQATFIRYILAKLSKFVQISTLTFSSQYFFDKNFYFVISNKLAKFYYQTDYFPSCSVKFVSCFMLRHLMMPWHLNIWKIKVWLSQKRKEVSKWNKKHFPLFHKCSFLDIKKQLAKMQQTQPLKEPQTISIYWFYLLRNHTDTSTKSK